MSGNPFLRKLFVTLLVFLCFSTLSGSADAQELSSPLWQKIEDARVYMSSNSYHEALKRFEQALDLAVKENDQAAQAICIGNLGTLCAMTDKAEEAMKYYKQGYELAKRQNNKILLAKFAGCLVRQYAQKGDARQARKWLDIQESLDANTDEDPPARFYAMYDKASVLYLENDAASALHYLYKAERYAEEHDLGPNMAGGALMAAGDILYKIKRYDEAIETYHKGLESIRKMGSRAQEIFALRSLYVAYKQVGDSINAAKYRERYKMVNDSMYDGMATEPAEQRLSAFEKRQNSILGETRFNESFFLICIVIVLLGILAFGAVAIHKLARRQKNLLDSREIIMPLSAGISDESLSGLPPLPSSTESKENPAANEAASSDKQSSSSDNEETMTDREYEKESVSPILTYEQQKTLLEKINLVMENVSLICREDFNLAMLAKAVGSNTKYVSKVINDLCGKTFKTYLNEYRIREACRRLIDKDNFGHLTIKAIHQELGFRTTTSFVAAFRKVMGMTPSEYKKLHGDSSEPDKESGLERGRPRRPEEPSGGEL